ncbi:molybdopterin molybdotransferase MoeA [Sulfurirhabdus autotrophica]|uniref:Molybdopterin molybdenumtransferase n=1 Tax=Sulfurirhabdus autotrophica TaxID=1706046 RepID=A0A4R3Y4N8_9PROT|nr:gephyrin-like molybdotransferase Glp [Sulfurirhabdus autotrophica]TCV86736.1 molybdopterin molybdotransferase [Sulfurirhabdus autotrophica]
MSESIPTKRPAMLSMDEALSYLLAQARPVTEIEHLETRATLGRVLAQAQISSLHVPPLDNSAMDGYAIACTDLVMDGGKSLPISQRIPAGTVGETLKAGTAARIFTGAPIPLGADAVVMQEECTAEGDTVTINVKPVAGQNIRRAGEDIATGAEILAPGTRIRPQEMGLAASVGIAKLPVFRKLRVAMFFTGDEIVMPGESLAPGQIYNSNRFSLTGLLQALGCEVTDLGIVPDNLEATVEVLQQASQNADLVVTSGGVSVGEEDYVKAAVERLGKLEMWRIAMKPGKPLAYGNVNKASFIGLPGNPVSALVTFCLFVRPFILSCQGVKNVMPRSCMVRADFEWPKPDRRREFLRAQLSQAEDGETTATIYPHQGSGVLTSTVWADGVLDIPSGKTVARGDRVKFISFSEMLY